MILTDADRQHPLWARIKAYLEERQTSIMANLAMDLNAEQTAKARGRLAEVVQLLAFEKETPTVEKVMSIIQ